LHQIESETGPASDLIPFLTRSKSPHFDFYTSSIYLPCSEILLSHHAGSAWPTTSQHSDMVCVCVCAASSSRRAAANASSRWYGARSAALGSHPLRPTPLALARRQSSKVDVGASRLPPIGSQATYPGDAGGHEECASGEQGDGDVSFRALASYHACRFVLI
jgi:hypothetical protein